VGSIYIQFSRRFGSKQHLIFAFGICIPSLILVALPFADCDLLFAFEIALLTFAFT